MENTTKALELLNLPVELSPVNGQITTVTKNKIVINKTYDFLRFGSKAMLPQNVKYTITSKSEVEINANAINTIDSFQTQSVELFGAYAYNLLANYIHGFGYSLQSPTQLVDNQSNNTMSISSTSNGWDLVCTVTPFIENTANPKLRGDAYDLYITTITGQASRKPDGTLTIIKENKTTSKARSNSVTKNELEAIGLSVQEIMDMTPRTFNVSTVNSDTHVTSMAMDIEKEGDVLKGVVYINGIKSSDIHYTSLMASYNKLFPDFVFRWMLYNGQNNSMTTGATWLKQYNSSDDNSIIVKNGSVFAVNGNEVTYNSAIDADLVAYMECLPAQGKNENVAAIIDLATSSEKLWA